MAEDMARLKVYGRPTAVRAALREKAKQAEGHLAAIEGAHETLRRAPAQQPGASALVQTALELLPYRGPLFETEREVDAWLVNLQRLLTKRFGPAADQFQVPRRRRATSDHSKQSEEERVRACQDAVHEGQTLIQWVLARLPEPARAAPRELHERFTELRDSGLLERAALDAILLRLSKTRTTAQVSEAIGAAKELVEACNRAACDLLDVEYPTDNAPMTGRIVRREITQRNPDISARAAEAIDRMFAGMTTVEHGLATLRNAVGTGHGRPKLPRGLRPRHGHLAIDIAEAHTRYLVATLHDMDRL